MPKIDLGETWKKEKKKKKKKKAEAMTVVAVVMVVMRHRRVEECQHRGGFSLPKPNRRNTQAMMQ
jgi:hypothetical protein